MALAPGRLAGLAPGRPCNAAHLPHLAVGELREEQEEKIFARGWHEGEAANADVDHHGQQLTGQHGAQEGGHHKAEKGQIAEEQKGLSAHKRSASMGCWHPWKNPNQSPTNISYVT